ncbi:leucine-rich repeat-containing protein let-4-like [Chironomus tepperi]|uniref:leucine-rich repeat-containing protein let-4-like n=1 Tax=Chironomus tepperi TaxID=113505 RepID=UPI00391F5439
MAMTSVNLNLRALCAIFLITVAADEECSFGFETGLGITVGHDYLYTCNIFNSTELLSVNRHRPGLNDLDVKFLQYKYDGYYEELDGFHCFSFPNLEQLGIIDIKVNKIDGQFLKDCRNLKHVFIASNGLTALPETLFATTISLEKLHIDHNDMESLPELIFSNLRQLRDLQIEYTKISSFPPKIFSSLDSLTFLDLIGNKITSLNPKWFENLQKLDHLHMSNNKIVEIPANAFSSLPKLTYITLARNNIKSLHSNSFQNLKSLKTLYLSNNDITDFPKNVFKSLESLTFLWIGDNKIKTIHSDSFGKHSNLVMSGMANNSIEGIDEKFIDNVALTHVFLGGNVCIKEDVKSNDRSVMKEKMKTCFENYRPRVIDDRIRFPEN